jgi:hypothetical protein
MRRPHINMRDLKRIWMMVMMLCFMSVSVFADGQKGEKPPPKEKPPVVVVAPKPPPPNSNGGGEKRGGKKP